MIALKLHCRRQMIQLIKQMIKELQDECHRPHY